MRDYLSYTGSKGRHAEAIVEAIGPAPVLVSLFCGGAAAEVLWLETHPGSEARLSDASPHPLLVLTACQQGQQQLMLESAKLWEREAATNGVVGSWRTFQGLVSHRLEDPYIGPASKAGMLIGCLRHTFSSLWRCSRDGRLNGSFDVRGRRVLSDRGAVRYAAALHRDWVSIGCIDWQDALSDVPAGAVIYCDPPYLGAGGFTAYGGGGGWTVNDATALAINLAAMPNRVVVSEQAIWQPCRGDLLDGGANDGGGPIYAGILGVQPQVLPIPRRNARGDQMARQRREEWLIVRPAKGM